ncbi:MAG: TraB/GumN family protein [Alphaproteobacteria bacterium]|nr:TraB/GumN family protein [Alphaproteobacteria bacterium]
MAAPVAAEPAKPAHAINANPAMWTVRGPQGTVYMLGSIHALPKNVNWQTPKLLAAMRRADVFAFEVPMDSGSREKAAAYFRANAILPGSVSLPSLFDAEMRSDFRDVMTLTHADPTYVVYMRPWLAALVLEGAASGTAGLYPSEGVDNKVYALAKAQGVRDFRALERDEDQFRLFIKDGHIEREVEDLRLTFKDILGHHGKDSTGLMQAWANGDTKALAALAPEDKATSAEFRKAWIEDRNRKWVPQIEAMLKEPRTFFITVGAAHLVGRSGVPNLLRAKGYRVDGP